MIEQTWNELMKTIRATVDSFLSEEVRPQMEQIGFRKLKATFTPASEDGGDATFAVSVTANHQMVWWVTSTLCGRISMLLKDLHGVDPNVKRISISARWDAKNEGMDETKITVYRTE